MPEQVPEKTQFAEERRPQGLKPGLIPTPYAALKGRSSTAMHTSHTALMGRSSTAMHTSHTALKGRSSTATHTSHTALMGRSFTALQILEFFR
jgi:heme/copper-type cytochrome/quinol oxidase subunit 3